VFHLETLKKNKEYVNLRQIQSLYIKIDFNPYIWGYPYQYDWLVAETSVLVIYQNNSLSDIDSLRFANLKEQHLFKVS